MSTTTTLRRTAAGLLGGTTALALALPAVARGGEGCTRSVDQCLNAMVTKLKRTGFIGVELEGSDEGGPLVVTKVVPESPAEKVGLQVGDELLALNGIRFGKDSWEKMARVKRPGREVTCTIKRDGEAKSMKLTLAPMPADLMAKYIGEHMMQHAKQEQHAVNP